MFIDSIKFNSKIKVLFLLIACICLFFSVSCIHAADVDNGVNNQSAVDINTLDDGNVAISDVSEVSADSFVVNASHPKFHNHLSDKSHFGNKDKKSLCGSCVNSSDLRHPHKSIKILCSNFEKSKLNLETSIDSNMICCSVGSIHTLGAGSQKLIALNVEKAINSDIIGQNTTSSFKNAVLLDSQLTSKCEPCCCGECQCGNDCNHYEKVLGNASVIAANGCGDDVTYSYTAGYNHIKSTANEEILLRFRNLDEDEIESRCNLINLTAFNCTQNHSEAEGEFTGFSAPSNMNTNGDFAIDYSNSLYDFAQFDCNINDFYSQKLDIKDYNLEYYMFTNPDIIVTRENTLAKTYTLTSNHCPNFDAKTAFNPTIFLNDLQHVFNKKLLASNCISQDNYIPSQFTVFYQNDFMLNCGACKSDRQTPINLSFDESAFPVLLVYGGAEKCLI